jgi:hypothetical protein
MAVSIAIRLSGELGVPIWFEKPESSVSHCLDDYYKKLLFFLPLDFDTGTGLSKNRNPRLTMTKVCIRKLIKMCLYHVISGLVR